MENNNVSKTAIYMTNSHGGHLKALDNEMVDTNENDDDTHNEADENTPVTTDKGWAWMVLLGAVIQMTLNIGTIKCSGIFFVAFQKKYESNSSVTALVTTIQFAVFSVSALFVMNVVVPKVGCRTVVMVGGAINAAAYVITALADDIRILFFSHGVLHGIGSACIEPCAYVMLGNYFVKRLGFANGISNSGGSLGALILAPSLTVTLEYYGYTGLMLIVSALMLNCCVSGALFRPQTYYTGRGDRRQSQSESAKPSALSGIADNAGESDDEDDETLMFLSNKAARDRHGDKPLVTRQMSVPSSQMSVQDYTCTYFSDQSDISDQSADDNFTGSPTTTIIKQRISFRDPSQNGSLLSKLVDSISKSNIALYGSSDHLGGSMLLIPSVYRQESTHTKVKDGLDTVEENNATLCESCLTLFDFQLLKNPTFVAFIISAALLCSANALGPIYIAPYAVDIGLTETEVAELLTVYGALDLFARILTGVVADRGWLRRSTIIALTSLVVCIFSHLLRFFVNFQWLMFYVVILGLFSGVFFCLATVVIVDYFTVAKLRSGVGFTSISTGGVASVAFFLVGYMRDVSGSYVLPFHVLGIMGVVGAAMMFSLPIIDKLYKNKRHGQKQQCLNGK